MRVLITAGPTREPIDAVRFISNRSSGRMGVALAQAAADAGHEVTLLLGPTPCPADVAARVRVERFESSADLERLLAEHFERCDVLLMVAAVADYRPAEVVRGKQERALDAKAQVVLNLVPTPDLVAAVARCKQPAQKVVAFSLEEPSRLEERAKAKMLRKGVDAIVANPLGTMESGDIDSTWMTASGEVHRLGKLGKEEFARWLIERVKNDV